MCRFCALLGLVSLGLVVASLIVGCGANQGGTSPNAKTKASTPGGPQGGIPEGLAELSEEDRAAALKQKVCPVTGVALGKMGPPPKLTVEGREVFICCEGCEKELRSNPKKFFAKLDAKKP